jgi:hypothetical protein
MAGDFPGWIAAPDAVRRHGISYTMLRKLVRDGVFTRGQFSAAKERPPIYVRVAELRAWKRGGVAAVEVLKRQTPELAPDVGEAGA